MEFGYTPDLIYSTQVRFPSGKEGQNAYVCVVQSSLSSLNSRTFAWISGYRRAIESQWGHSSKMEAHRVTGLVSTRFYTQKQYRPALCLPAAGVGLALVYKSNPTVRNVALVVAAVSLSVIGLLARLGHHTMVAYATQLDLLDSINRLEAVERGRLRKIQADEQSIGRALTRPPEDWVAAFEAVQLEKDGARDAFWQKVKGYLQAHTVATLSDFNSYTNASRYQALEKLYASTGLQGALNELRATQAVYAWTAALDPADSHSQYACLVQLLEEPGRYRPLLEQKAAELQNLLAWDTFSTLDSDERQAVLARFNLLVGCPTTQTVVDKAFGDLREHILDVQFQEREWTPDYTSKLYHICEDLNLQDEFRFAQRTNRVEWHWVDISMQERIDHTRELIPYRLYYVRPLERRRREVFDLAERSHELADDVWEYTVLMLKSLTPDCPDGCNQKLQAMRETLLSRMAKMKKKTLQQSLSELAWKTELLEMDASIMAVFQSAGVFSRLKEFFHIGKSRAELLKEQIPAVLVNLRSNCRRRGFPTVIDRAPKAEELGDLELLPSHLEVVPPVVPEFIGDVDLLDLVRHIRRARTLFPARDNDRGVVPDVFNECYSTNSTARHPTEQHLGKLEIMLRSLNAAGQRTAWLERVRQVLRHYTSQVNAKLKSCTADLEKREVYTEIVELIGREMGFAFYHCPDGQLNAAMTIYREKIAPGGVQEASVPTRALMWVARKRDLLFTQIVQELIQANARFSARGHQPDVASALGRWRHVFRKVCGLGDVLYPAYDYLDGGISAGEFEAKWRSSYTPQWLIAEAMKDYREHVPEVCHNTIHSFLTTRIVNYEDIQGDLFDDDLVHFQEIGMALYLQEVGLFKAIV